MSQYIVLIFEVIFERNHYSWFLYITFLSKKFGVVDKSLDHSSNIDFTIIHNTCKLGQELLKSSVFSNLRIIVYSYLTGMFERLNKKINIRNLTLGKLSINVSLLFIIIIIISFESWILISRNTVISQYPSHCPRAETWE